MRYRYLIYIFAILDSQNPSAYYAYDLKMNYAKSRIIIPCFIVVCTVFFGELIKENFHFSNRIGYERENKITILGRNLENSRKKIIFVQIPASNQLSAGFNGAKL